VIPERIIFVSRGITVYDTLTSGVVADHVLRVGLQVKDVMVLGIDRNAYFISHIFSENRSFYEINMKNMAGSGRPQNNTAQKVGVCLSGNLDRYWLHTLRIGFM